VVINFGGIDSFKAESYEYDEALQEAGMASCAIDMPGVGCGRSVLPGYEYQRNLQ
jgi:hypothetical protein